MYLELFEGKIGVEELMNLEQPLITDLAEAKERFIEAKRRIQASYESNRSSASKPRTYFDNQGF